MLLTLRWFHYILVLAIAAYLIVLTLSEGTADAFMQWLNTVLSSQGGRMAVAGVATFLVAMQAFMAVRSFTLRRYAREIGYQNDLGKVSVSLVAIEEALTRAIEGEPGVRRVSLRVYEDRVKRCVIIEPILTLWEDVNVTAINHRCQHLLRARFVELMPERDQVQVNLTLHRLNQRQAVDTAHGVKEVPATTIASEEPQAVTHDPATAIAAVSAVAAATEVTDAPRPAVIYAEDQPVEVGVETVTVVDEAEDVITSPAERIRSERLAAVKAVNQRKMSEVNDEEDLDYESLYAGPTYPVDYGDADDEDEAIKSS
jgi:hypothetical protein